MYGAVNWFDLSAAACGEMVFDLMRELGVPLTLEIATHVYVAILTDTGSFHYSQHHAADVRDLPAVHAKPASTRRPSPAASSTATTSDA